MDPVKLVAHAKVFEEQGTPDLNIHLTTGRPTNKEHNSTTRTTTERQTTRSTTPRISTCLHEPPTMSSPQAPSRTPEHAPPPLHPACRSFTVPARLRSSPAPVPASTDSADGIETLVVCPHSRIVSFTAAGALVASGEAHIAWRTPAERTLAVGMWWYTLHACT